MSLVTNLKSPFTKTTPLVTIVLLAVLFAIFRLSGGSVRIERSPTRIPERQIESNRPIPSAPLKASDLFKDKQAVRHSETTGKISLSDSEADDFMRRVLESRREKENVKDSATRRQEESRPKRGGLEDIEKDLGLR